MKRTGYLYEKIAAPDNLRIAFVKAAQGKNGRREVVLFRSAFERNILKLHRDFLQKTLNIGNYTFFHVRDPKQRLICAASFPERVIHHAIMNYCEPILDRYAIYDSYACRTGKGVCKAVKRCKTFAEVNKWFLKLDIYKYFASIDQQRLLHMLTGLIKDPHLLDLFQLLLSTYSTTRDKGLPIGNLVSQHLANFYLGCFDHWLKEKRGVKCYLRYMDDFVLFADSKQQLIKELDMLIIFLEHQLSLSLKNDIQLNRCQYGVSFLGFKVFPNTIRLSRRSKQRFKEKLRRYEYLCQQGLWTEQELCDHITPLIEFTKNSNAFAFRQNILQRYGGSF